MEHTETLLVRSDNSGICWTRAQITPIEKVKDLFERLDEDGPVPAGECPCDGTLVYRYEAEGVDDVVLQEYTNLANDVFEHGYYVGLHDDDQFTVYLAPCHTTGWYALEDEAVITFTDYRMDKVNLFLRGLSTGLRHAIK